jgi:hypothetical protein
LSVGFYFIYFCRISDRYGLTAGSIEGTIEVAEFATALEANSTLAVGNSAVEQLRGAFRTIDEELLKELAALRYCPEECRLDLDVSASSSAHGENDKICNNPGAPVFVNPWASLQVSSSARSENELCRDPVPATTRPSLRASVGQLVTSNATIGVALAASAAFIALVVLVVSGRKVALRFSFWDEWRHL